ncbi:MAG: DNA repair exonuclease [Chloroflexi bacterium]|nr:DNA repair exonuclease [Chloroflexota bacterium]MDA1146227.1 DNA repair exonuclease [Chloroflexota bacterium]
MTTTRRPKRRLLHTSDVHLGAYDYGDGSPARDQLHANFARVIDIAIREKVDFALIAGDFFDNARVWEDTLEYAAAQIARLEAPVVIAPGNHDHVGPRSVYDRLDFATHAPNLRVMRTPNGETVALEDLDVEIWARSHTEELPDFQPFSSPPPRGDAAWQIGAGHGHFIHPKALLHHSFHIREEHLVEADRDYVALGHWEQMTRVAAGDRTIAAYSGAPEGLGHGSEVGGRVLIVDLHEDGTVELQAHSLGDEPPLAHHEIPYLEAL